MSPISITLPCGKVGVVGEFSGAAQRHIHDVLQALESGRQPAIDWEEKVLLETVSKLGSRKPTERDLLDLASGSRRRLFIEARRLTYGDEVLMEWTCAGRLGCTRKSTRTISLADLKDIP